MRLGSISTFAMLSAACAALSGCSNRPEDVVVQAAERMNALKDPRLDSARADGKWLIVRYKPIPTGGLSDSELARMTAAGLCTISSIKSFMETGGSIRLELPQNGNYLGIEIERCDGSEPRMTTINADGSKHVAANSWPTGAPVQD
jgi:hypothetical protein